MATDEHEPSSRDPRPAGVLPRREPSGQIAALRARTDLLLLLERVLAGLRQFPAGSCSVAKGSGHDRYHENAC
jgi:hypothetical protein